MTLLITLKHFGKLPEYKPEDSRNCIEENSYQQYNMQLGQHFYGRRREFDYANKVEHNGTCQAYAKNYQLTFLLSCCDYSIS